MKIDIFEVHRIAALAQLELTPDEAARLSADLSNILDYVDQLKEYGGDTTGDAGATADGLRPDVAEPRDPAFAAANAPAFRDGFFVVPRVLGE